MIYSITEPQDEDLATRINKWSVKEVIYGPNEESTHHLVGFIYSERAGRTSSAIQAFDKENMLVTTSSGRVYKLEEKPGKSREAEYVWQMWKKVNNAKNEKDVTREYWTDT